MSLIDTFAAMRDKPNAKPQGNMILKMIEIGEKTIKGEIMSGPAAGKIIEVKPSGHLDIKDYTKGKSKTVEGGLLRLERVKEGTDGIYTCRWSKTFNAKPTDKQTVLFEQVAKLVEIPGRRDSNGAKMMFLNILDLATDTQPTTAAELRSAIAAALGRTGTAALFVSDAEGGFYEDSIRLHTKREGGKTVPLETPEERAAEVVSRLGENDEAVNKLLSGTSVSVVDSKGYPLGSDTSAGIETRLKEASEAGKFAQIGTVNPDDFKTTSLGLRIAGALAFTGDNAIPREVADELKKGFLETASEAAAADFHKGGWVAVSDHALRSFFSSRGVELAKVPEASWSVNAVLLQKFEGSEDRFFVPKTFRTTGAISPYPAVKACEDLRSNFRNELREAILTVAATAEKTADKAEKAGPGAAKQEAVKETEAERAARLDQENMDIDDILDGLGSEEIGEIEEGPSA